MDLKCTGCSIMFSHNYCPHHRYLSFFRFKILTERHKRLIQTITLLKLTSIKKLKKGLRMLIFYGI